MTKSLTLITTGSQGVVMEKNLSPKEKLENALYDTKTALALGTLVLAATVLPDAAKDFLISQSGIDIKGIGRGL